VRGLRSSATISQQLTNRPAVVCTQLSALTLQTIPASEKRNKREISSELANMAEIGRKSNLKRFLHLTDVCTGVSENQFRKILNAGLKKNYSSSFRTITSNAGRRPNRLTNQV